MKPGKATLRLWAASVLVIGLCAGAWADPVAASRPASQATTQSTAKAVGVGPSDAAARAEELKAAGLEAALEGQFEAGIEKLRRARQFVADDPDLREAVRLIEKYLSVRGEFNRERRTEYEAASQRVRQALVAQKALPELTETGLAEKLRRRVRSEDSEEPDKGVVSAFDRAATAHALEGADAEEAKKLKADTLKALGKALKALGPARRLLKGRDDPYARSFRSLADRCEQRLKGYREAWAAVETDTPEAREKGAEQVKTREDDLAQALGGLETMVSKKPWQVALGQARLAKELAPEGMRIEDEPWYGRLTEVCAQEARRAMDRAQWYDALNAYGGLKEIQPGNEKHRENYKSARRHVRVLRMYGEESQEGETTWKDQVEGIDARMVEDAISALSRAYVTSVDYRKAVLGALKSTRVLAETPQVAETFPALKEEKQKKEFVEAVDWAIRNFDQKDRISSLDLKLALNSVLLASERTVDIPTSVLAREFAEGFLAELDKFSSMVWPYDYSEFRKRTVGRFFGVGIQITKEPGEPLKVVTPLADSPAFRQGIKAGDLIIKVDGKSTVKYDIQKLVRMITGKEGTQVVLTIKRDSLPKPIGVPIVREEIRIRTIKGWRVSPEGDWSYCIDRDAAIAYIRLTQFTQSTREDLVEAIDEARRQDARSVVLDLRFNPGGLLRTAQEVADEFLPGGKIVSTRGRQQALDVRRADESGHYLHGDMVVLTNEASASAAEIVAGALKDWRRATVVGQRSYGKGSVQNVIPIRYDKALLKLTTAYYYLPSGRLLHREEDSEQWGVNPDVPVALTPKQMKRWLDLQQETSLLRKVDSEEIEQELREQYDADLQLQTAVLLLKLKRLQEEGAAAPTSTARRAEKG